MKWSVAIEVEGDREVTREEVVELADAVAANSGIASGIGTNRYGAQVVVEAGGVDEAIEAAKDVFTAAAARAGLPAWPVVRVEAGGEADVLDEAADDGVGDLTGDLDGPG